MPPGPGGSQGRRPRDSKGLEGIISFPIMHWRAFFILFHHFYTEKKQLYILYFLRITASRPAGHVFVWLPHLNFMNNPKHVGKYILLHFLISFLKNHENLCSSS